MAEDESEIRYTTQKTFKQSDIKDLFASVEKSSAEYPIRLYSSLMSAPYVLTACNGDTLVGLLSAIDDGELNAFVKRVIVSPDCPEQGVAQELLAKALAHYAEYFSVDVAAHDAAECELLASAGFQALPGRTLMRASNTDESLKY